MIDPDITAREAFAHLSVRDDPRSQIGRRRFLQLVGMGVGAGALLDGGGLLDRLVTDGERQAWAAAPLPANQGVLVLIGMYGGNDGLNTVVPYSNPKYTAYRSNIAIATNQLLTLNAEVGLHPNLGYLKTLWDQQKLAVVQGVGYPNPNLSHFDAMATWMYGRADTPVGPPGSGWIGRWLDGLGSNPDLLTAAVIGSDLPLHMVGLGRQAVCVPDWGFAFGGGTHAHDQRMYTAVRAYAASPAGRGPWFDSFAGTERSQLDVTAAVSPVFQPALPTGVLSKKLTIAARLINAGIGLRVIDASIDNFDTHSDELSDHGARMSQLSNGIQSFYAALDPALSSRVTIMTFSEFGRTPWSNGSGGTDHGTANNHFVIGGNVNGGLFGHQPSLVAADGSDLDQWDRLDFNVDFRSMYATVLDGVLGGDAATVLGGSFSKLELFRPAAAPPGSGGGGGGAPNVITGSELVSIVPDRLLDTRLGAGAAIGPAGTITLGVAGVRSVPANAVAAVLNVTAVGATAASYVTVWPTGVDRPGTSSLNVRGGDVVPNLVITKLGALGQVDIYNNAGRVHCVVDVVGYFQNEPASRFTSLSPARILDTRSGLGSVAGPVGQGAAIDLVVAGEGGVDADADTVVLNVTVTEPTGEGYVTVWPSGATMPTASNLNFVPGQTVPNLVISRLGANGQVSLFNSSGNTHLIADVLGSFRAAGGSRLTSLSPSRLLDTRSDGGSAHPVGQTPLVLPVLGRGGVPASGVTAVVLNVTATGGNASGYVTVYPSGQGAPTASNLNTSAGQTRANLVIAKVGADGAVAMFNSAGQLHLVADVVGYFTG